MYMYKYKIIYRRGLKVKLPTIWAQEKGDGKSQRRKSNEKVREEKKQISKKSKSEESRSNKEGPKKEDAGA